MLKPFQYYIVSFTFQFAAWDERGTMTERVTAQSKSDACKRMRAELRDRGYLSAGTGRINCSAKLDEDQRHRD